MILQSEWFRPNIGDIVFDKKTDRKLGVVSKTDGNICYFNKPCGQPNSYIWRFIKLSKPYGPRDFSLDCLNKLHYTWPPTVYRETPAIKDTYGTL